MEKIMSNWFTETIVSALKWTSNVTMAINDLHLDYANQSRKFPQSPLHKIVTRIMKFLKGIEKFLVTLALEERISNL